LALEKPGDALGLYFCAKLAFVGSAPSLAPGQRQAFCARKYAEPGIIFHSLGKAFAKMAQSPVCLAASSSYAARHATSV